MSGDLYIGGKFVATFGDIEILSDEQRECGECRDFLEHRRTIRCAHYGNQVIRDFTDLATGRRIIMRTIRESIGVSEGQYWIDSGEEAETVWREMQARLMEQS